MVATLMMTAYADCVKKPGFYVGLGAGIQSSKAMTYGESAGTHKSGNFAKSGTLPSGNLKLGYTFPTKNIYIGTEGLIGFGFGKSELTDRSSSNGPWIRPQLYGGLHLHIGIFAKQNVACYVIVGGEVQSFQFEVKTGDPTASSPYDSISNTHFGPAFGFGIRTYVSKRISLGLQYTYTIFNRKQYVDDPIVRIKMNVQRAMATLCYHF